MHPQMQTETHAEWSTYADIEARETDLLVGCGFAPHEIASLVLPRPVVPDGRERPREQSAPPGVSAVPRSKRRAGRVARPIPAQSLAESSSDSSPSHTYRSDTPRARKETHHVYHRNDVAAHDLFTTSASHRESSVGGLLHHRLCRHLAAPGAHTAFQKWRRAPPFHLL